MSPATDPPEDDDGKYDYGPDHESSDLEDEDSDFDDFDSDLEPDFDDSDPF